MVHPVPADPATSTDPDRTGGIRVQPLPGAEPLADVLLDVARYRAAHPARLGAQRHDADPVILARLNDPQSAHGALLEVIRRLAQEYEIPTPLRAGMLWRIDNRRNSAATWASTATAALSEVVATTVTVAIAPNDPNATGELYDELIRAAATLTAWAQDVGRRRAEAIGAAETGADNDPV